jgi:hypothetical protein
MRLPGLPTSVSRALCSEVFMANTEDGLNLLCEKEL